MCLIYVLGFTGVLLTIVSGRYQQHAALLWTFLTFTSATGLFYSWKRRMMARPDIQERKASAVAEVGTGVCGFATLGLFVWLCVVIWR